FTDRPAYRPEETVQWKIIARARRNEEWTTPAGQQIAYEINSPRGEKVSSGVAKLNDFGSFWAELPLTASMPLGAYHVTFKIGEDWIGSAQLFRLEEYKLPEFAVTVSTPEGKVFRLGDTIEATIEANYYFGGPVANATVEAVVYQQPYYRVWYPWRKYPWYYPPPPTDRGEQVMRRETLRTDANGRATLRIDTQRDGAEMLYRIEARVVDASRREVRGEGSLRVLRQRYSVIAHPEHYLHRPGDQVEVDFKAVDANDRPVQTTGTVTVIRREWRAKDVNAYHEEEVLAAKVTTDANGEATFRFTPKREGYYAIRWSSEDIDPNVPTRVRDLVTAETAVWVADRTTRDLGYFASGGVEIIVDRETMRAGETASVMIVTPSSGRWVVFTASGDDILDTQVLRVDGTVKLVQLPLDDRHVPNFFVTASSIFDRTFSTDTERIVVPPVEHFLNVDVKADREQYEPRQEGTLTVTTRDVDGKPVSAEVALAVSDEAVTAIQQDMAGDPRQFFFGEQRHQTLQVSAGVHAQQYVRLVQRDTQLIDDRYVATEEEDARLGRRRQARFADGVASGIVGGTVGEVSAEAAAMAPTSAPPPPPPSPARPDAITVTAQAADMRKEAAQSAGNIAVEVRSDFRSTAFWKPDVVTDASGTATVKFRYPEALTTWRATARAASRGSQFGIGSSTARTNMPLIVRLQAPRFFVVGDRTVVSAVINNNTGTATRVEPKLEVEGLTLASGAANAPVQVPARGEARVDWTVVSEKPGTAKLRVTGRGETHGDAMEKTFLVYEHGIDKLVARSGKLRASEAIVKLDLPRERRSTDLVVQVAPSVAVTMLDALPYLLDFPYGCTEQTMSRFLPAAIVAQTIEKLGGGKRVPAHINDKKLAAVTAASMARLYDFQHEDGGWGWWKEGDSDPFMTAYVLWGFSIARDAGLGVNERAVDRAAQWLDTQLSEREGDWNLQAWMLHALSAWRKQPTANAQKAFDRVWTNRERLTAYSRALLALTAHRYGNAERAAILVRNLENGAKIDRTPDQSVLIRGGSSTAETMATVHWGQDGFWWRWYEGPVETTAFVLQALVTIDPKHELVEPAMNWLVKNRRGAQWSNTRDTAIAILALNDYLRASGETLGDVAYEVTVNGKVIASKTVTAAEALSAPSRFPVDPALLADAQQEIRIRRTGGRADAALYFSAEARFVSLEEPVTAAGNELFVKREYFRLAPRPTLLKGVLYDRIPLRDRDAIESGERVEVVVTVETKNDYEYLMFEDLKPAGFEAVALQSGQSLFATDTANRSAWVYQELRDRKVAMFIDRLAQGIWEIRYTLRAETPGSFHALPLLGQAMYVPDIRANGEEVRVEVTE
ncbi:MAG TPA: alpha-2-macroglobulin family protein, partial [Thermoanaerobaculia bacterium]|nr:alpha-2-macroglobulin family protein [Thermoanaerobaculia bacterium]